ncbi:MAG TPA: alpha/beta fold hydrolase [Caulobacteraceae bacterium]
MIDVGGRRIHALAAGRSGEGPLVVLEAGAFGFSADWAMVQEGLAARDIRSLAYDRAGLGFSDAGPRPRDSAAIVADLESLLAGSGETGPFVLCGHSMAGLSLRLFCSRNRDRVAGVVLVDATTPEAMDSRLLSGLVGQFGAFARMAAWAAGAGLFRHFAHTSWGDRIGLEGAAATEKRWAFASAGHNHWAAEEVAHWRTSADQAREAGPFDFDLPISVVLAEETHGRSALRRLQIAPALASRSGSVTEATGASHATILSEPYAATIVTEIERVRAAAAAC